MVKIIIESFMRKPDFLFFSKGKKIPVLHEQASNEITERK